MASFQFGDFTPTGPVSDATDANGALTMTLWLSPADRVALQEIAEYAGRVMSYMAATGPEVFVDTTGGLNTFFVTTGAAAQTDSGWFAVRSISDQWGGSITHAQVRLDLVRLAAANEAKGTVIASTEFIANDF